jgi:hypothetical protein
MTFYCLRSDYVMMFEQVKFELRVEEIFPLTGGRVRRVE